MKRILLFLFISLLPFVSGYAFLENNITLLTMQDGLSDNNVSCIYKDSDNFMWFGTDNGINRYDGKTIRHFSNGALYMRVSGMRSISDTYLAVIADDRLYYFNRKTEVFVPVSHASDHSGVNILELLPHGSSDFWGISERHVRLYRFQEMRNKDNEVTEIQLSILKEKIFFKDGDKEVLSAFCYAGAIQKLALGTNRGRLFLLNPQTLELEETVHLTAFDSHMRITSIYADNYSIWATTIANGIFRLHISTRKIEHITYGGNPAKPQLSHTDVYQIVPINEEQTIAVTWSGYTILTCDKETHEFIRSDVYKTLPIAYRNVETRMMSVYYDMHGQLWIGTNGGGVIRTDLQKPFYHQYYQERHNEICGIAVDDERYVWLATFHRGIMKSKHPFEEDIIPEFDSVGPENVRSKSTVLCALKDSAGTLWFGNNDGTLTSCHPASGRFQVHSIPKLSAPVWALYIDSLQHLWVGTEKGLYFYEPETGKSGRIPVEQYIKSKKVSELYVRAIVSSRNGELWLGTSNAGVCRLKLTPDRNISLMRTGYETEAGIAYWSVRSLLASGDGNLYVGYQDGFGVIPQQADSITDFYTIHNGLYSNFIGTIVEDEKGRIWLGNNSGIARYSRHQHLFYNYYIVGSNRSSLSYGNMLFWGNNRSLTYFNPDALSISVADDKVHITVLEVNNKPVSINEPIHGQVILKKGISYTDSVVLANDNRNFSLTFNNLSYSHEQQKYTYRLLPYQKDWVVADNGEKAVYTNLPEGDYQFEVKNIYPDGQSGDITMLKITILPHWSRTILFRLFVLAFFIGMLVYVAGLLRRRQKRIEHELQMKHELLCLSLEREKERQVRLERENFFTNVAHELRTPLMLILSPLQELLQQLRPSDAFYNKLFLMYKNGASLNTLVNHLLYVQKIEAGMVKLRLSEANIIAIIRDVAETFRPMAEVKGFRFDLELPEPPLLLWIDIEKIIMAIRNLLSNAFKYTPAGGRVSVRLSRIVSDGKNFVEIVISDTGAGIPAELQDRIFDSFITGDTQPTFSTKVGVGLRIVKNTIDLHHGLVKLNSAPGEGSAFTLQIPEGKEHFAEDTYEWIDSQQAILSMDGDLSFSAPVAQESISALVEDSAEDKGATKKILIIEDNEDVRLYLCSLFARKYTVYQAVNGEEGVHMASELLPDLVISDIMMPVKDGMTCCSEIRNRQSTAHIPILMLTAKAEDTDVLQGYRSGADEYMMKPFNPAILVAKAENLMLQRERLKRIYTKALMIKADAEGKEEENPFMQQVINVIEMNMANENFNVKTLAEQLNMSQPTLYRRMKQHSDLAVVDVIRSVRISKAASLLMANCYSIQQVSEMVGYSDARTLRKHFTEQFGVSPSKYVDRGEK